MLHLFDLVKPLHTPPLDSGFRPAALANRVFHVEKTVIVITFEQSRLPLAHKSGKKLRCYLVGCQIGCYLGACDRKVSALMIGD
jgi:hypothetical protein